MNKKTIMGRLQTCVLAWICNLTVAWGCTCLGSSTFCEVLTGPNHFIHPEKPVVHAIVEDKEEDAIFIRVLEVLHGRVERQTFRLPTGSPSLCRVSNAHFTVGHEYLFILGSSHEEIQPPMFGCVRQWLEIRDGVVFGPIVHKVKEMSLDKLSTMQECGYLGDVIGSLYLRATLVDDAIRLESSMVIDDVRVALFDMAGRILYDAQNVHIGPEQQLTVPSGFLPAGVYILNFQVQGRQRAIRVVKAS